MDMPLYDYRCDECSKEFEAQRKIADMDTDYPCPHCGTIGIPVVLLSANPGKVSGGTPVFHR